MSCNKKCYITRKEAKKQMKWLNKKGGKKLNLKNIYFCKECLHWHTTSILKSDFRDKNK